MFIHDFAEISAPFTVVERELVNLPELLPMLVGPAFDLTLLDEAAPWPVSLRPRRRRDDGWVQPVWWPAGQAGLVPAVEADLGFFPCTATTCYLELLGTYQAAVGRSPVERGRRVHLQVVMGARRLVQALAAGFGPAGAIELGQGLGPVSSSDRGVA